MPEMEAVIPPEELRLLAALDKVTRASRSLELRLADVLVEALKHTGLLREIRDGLLAERKRAKS